MRSAASTESPVACGGPTGIVAKLTEMGEGWRLNPFAFTGVVTGDFPLLWFLTMMFIAFIGGISLDNDMPV